MTESEDTLVTQAVGGDHDALTSLLERYGTELRDRLAPKISGSWRSVLEADDVMQVTYLEAFMRIRQFEPTGPRAFLRWLTQIAENNLLDAVKELGRAKRPQPADRITPHHGEDSCVALLELMGCTTTTPSREAARCEAGQILDDALRGLPEDYERVVRWYDLDGRPIDEVADAMGRSPGAIHMLRARAHDRLRELLGESTRFFSHPA